MEYVELLRVRRGLIVFAVANLFLFLAFTFALHGHGGFHVNVGLDKNGTSLGDLINAAGFSALFVATFFAGHLAAETPTLSFLWTKPVSRTVLAVRYAAVDAIALVAAVAIGTLMLVALIAGLGQIGRLRLDAQVLPSLALSVGAVLAWYGLCALAASRFDRDVANNVIALSWPVFIFTFMLSIVALPPPAHAVTVFLNQFDPFAYLLGSEHRDMGLVAASMWTRAGAMWAIALISIAGATRLWTTREG
jgi:hypothetical protein